MVCIGASDSGLGRRFIGISRYNARGILITEQHRHAHYWACVVMGELLRQILVSAGRNHENDSCDIGQVVLVVDIADRARKLEHRL
jgi:hypothetical protein